MYNFELPATMFSIVGYFFIVKQKWQGYVFWIFSNILWGLIAIQNKLWWLLFLQMGFYNIMCAIGLISWRKQSNK